MRGYIKMICCFIAVWMFIQVVPMALDKLKTYKAIIEKSEKLGIDNAALFYSEEEHTSLAEREISSKLSPE